jgi:hypothetical protein
MAAKKAANESLSIISRIQSIDEMKLENNFQAIQDVK